MRNRKSIDLKLKKFIEDNVNTSSTNSRIMVNPNDKSHNTQSNPSLIKIIKENNNFFPSFRKKPQINENELFEKYNCSAGGNDSIYLRDPQSSKSKRIEKIEKCNKIEFKVFTNEEHNAKESTLCATQEEKVAKSVLSGKNYRKVYIIIFFIVVVVIVLILIYFEII